MVSFRIRRVAFAILAVAIGIAFYVLDPLSGPPSYQQAAVDDSKNMRALVINSSKGLQMKRVLKPSPGPNEVLVKVSFISLIPIDKEIAEHEMFIPGLCNPSRSLCGVGADISGEISALGSNVTQFRLGDLVFGGFVRGYVGAASEYTVMDVRNVALLPRGWSLQEASVLVSSASTVVNVFERDCSIDAALKKKQNKDVTVLVAGGATVTGTMAIQLARAMGANRIVALCGADSKSYCLQQGAHEVWDRRSYVSDELGKKNYTFDVVLETFRSPDLFSNVKHECFVALDVGDTPVLFFAQLAWRRFVLGHKQYMFHGELDEDHRVYRVAEWVEKGAFHKIPTQVFPFEQFQQAFARLGSGSVRGRVLLKL